MSLTISEWLICKNCACIHLDYEYLSITFGQSSLPRCHAHRVFEWLKRVIYIDNRFTPQHMFVTYSPYVQFLKSISNLFPWGKSLQVPDVARGSWTWRSRQTVSPTLQPGVVAAFTEEYFPDVHVQTHHRTPTPKTRAGLAGRLTERAMSS